MNKSNLADLVNFSNSAKKTESKLNFGRNTVNHTSTQSNKFYIGKNKNEVSYSDMMFRKDQTTTTTPNTTNNNSSSVIYSQTQKKPFFNNNVIKK